MARLTVDLEPLTGLYRAASKPVPELLLTRALVKNALACEMAGADGVVLDVDKELRQAKRKALSVLVESLGVGVCVRAHLEEGLLEWLQELKPAMVALRYEAEKKEMMAGTITRLQVENILVGLEVTTDVELVKEAAKLKCDYVIFDCQAYCIAKTLSQKIDELNKLAKLSALARRLSAGPIAMGDFSEHDLTRLAKNSPMEEFFLGLPLLSSSLLGGYAQAVSRAKSLIS